MIYKCCEPEWVLPAGFCGMVSLISVFIAIVSQRILTGSFYNPFKPLSIKLFWGTFALAILLGVVFHDKTVNPDQVAANEDTTVTPTKPSYFATPRSAVTPRNSCSIVHREEDNYKAVGSNSTNNECSQLSAYTQDQQQNSPATPIQGNNASRFDQINSRRPAGTTRPCDYFNANLLDESGAQIRVLDIRQCYIVFGPTTNDDTSSHRCLTAQQAHDSVKLQSADGRKYF